MSKTRVYLTGKNSMQQISKTCIFYLFQEIHQQQTVAQSTAAMENDSLDVECPPAAKAKKKTLDSFFKETACTAPRASLSTTFYPMAQFREAVAAELNAYIYRTCHV